MVEIALASLAFSAGLVSFVNPCGFALLPVYFTYYFKNENLEKSSFFRRLFFGLLMGLTVSLGFAVVFAIAGIAVSYIGNGFLRYTGWFDLFAGIALIIIGVVYLFNLNSRINIGGYVNKLTNLGEKLKSAKTSSKYSSFFLYGIGFAIASLGCTLPVFLFIVTASIKSSGIFNGIAVFLIYAAGMGFLMTLFSAAASISKAIIEKTMNKFIFYIHKIGAVIVIIAGIYLVYNQIMFGALIV